MNLKKKLIDKREKKRNKTFWTIASIFNFPISLYLSGIIAQLFDGRGKFSVFEEQEGLVFWGEKYFEFIKEHFLLTFASFIIAFILISFIALYFKLSWINRGEEDGDRNFQISDSDAYGSSGWLQREEMLETLHAYKNAKETDEIILGLDVNTNEVLTIPNDSLMNRHIAVFGASGTKKSRAFVCNHILQSVRRGESMILTDPSGELYEKTSDYLRRNNYDVKVLNLVHLQHSDSWNCLSEVDNDINAQIFADVIIENTGGKNSNDFWAQCEMSLLKALCLYVILNDHIPTTMAEVYNLLTTRSSIELDALFNELPFNDETQAAKMAYNIFKGASDNIKGGVVIGLGTRLQVFQSGLVREITSHNEIDLEAPGHRKCAYFCITSDQHSAFDFLAVLFYSMLFIKLVSSAQLNSTGNNSCLPVFVNFILDEFPNIGAIPDFTKKISTVRKYGLNISVIFQNIAQLQNRYPHGQWEEILGNCDTNISLGVNDMTTATYLSNLSGDVTIQVSSQAHSKKTTSHLSSIDYKESNSIGKRKLLTPDEVKGLGREEELIFLRGKKPLKALKFDYSLHPESDNLMGVKVADYVPEWKKINDRKKDEELKRKKQQEYSGSIQEKYEKETLPLRDRVEKKHRNSGNRPSGF